MGRGQPGAGRRRGTALERPDRPLPAALLASFAGLRPSGDRGQDLAPLAELVADGLGAQTATIVVSRERGVDEHRWVCPGLLVSPSHQFAQPLVLHRRPVGRFAVGLDHPATEAQADRLREAAVPLAYIVACTGAELDALEARHEVSQLGRLIADDRQRVASQMESERYSLERDLHDGAQLHLVALQIGVALLEHRLEQGSGETAAAVDKLAAQIEGTHGLLMDTAAGVMPVRLIDQGLAPALSERFAGSTRVTLLVDPAVQARRYPADVERAVYFACLEAVSNAHKHAPGSRVTLRLRNRYHGLWFEIADDGPGMAGSPAGLHQLRDRLAGVGGSLEVASTAGGTSVFGTVPI